MAATLGLGGLVTSWADGSGGSFNSALLAKNAPNEFTLDLSGDDLDITAFLSGLLTESHTPGLRGWSGSYSAIQANSSTASPQAGHLGLVSGATYSTNVRAYEITATARAHDATAFQPTNAWRTFLGGLWSWSGTYEAMVDSSTGIALPDESTASQSYQSATFTLSSGNTWAGSIFSTQVSPVVRVDDINVVRYSFRGTGAITITGSNAGAPPTTGATSITEATPVAGSLVLQAATSRTYTGSAFPTSVSLRASLGDVHRIQVGFQGTGALTVA